MGGGVGASGTWPLGRIQKKELHRLAVGVPRPALPPSGCVSDRFSAAPNSSPIASTCCCPCKQAWAVRGALWRALCNEDGVAKVAKEQKKRTTTIKKTHKHAQPDTHTLATKHTGSMHWHCTEHLQEADAGRREGGGRFPCRGVQPAVGVAGVGHGCGGRCCLVANQVCSHRFLARIPAMPIWMHVHNTDMNTHTHHHTGLAETDPGAPCFAATTGCTPCWQQAKKSVWGGRYFVGTKVPTGAEQQNGNEILHFENNRILPTVCCLSKV